MFSSRDSSKTFLAPANQHSSSDSRASSFQPSLHYAVTSIQPHNSTLRHHPAFQPRTLLFIFFPFLTSLLISPLSNISRDYFLFLFIPVPSFLLLLLLNRPLGHLSLTVLAVCLGLPTGPLPDHQVLHLTFIYKIFGHRNSLVFTVDVRKQDRRTMRRLRMLRLREEPDADQDGCRNICLFKSKVIS